MPRRKGGGAAKVDFASVNDILVPYRRVSTREQADKGAGLAAQKTTLTAGLTMRGQVALEWDCVDKGKSGKDMNRPELERALSLVRSGQAGGIIVSKLDRLSRSFLDFAYLMETARKEGWNIVALDLGVDLRTPAGEVMAGVLALFAQFERRMIGMRTKDAWPRSVLRVRAGPSRSVSDGLLEAIVALYLSEENFSQVARMLNEAGLETPHGGVKWYPATVQKIVTSQDGRALIEELAA
jgi:DNA invertase Pin-like site-specific DNA recombinase